MQDFLTCFLFVLGIALVVKGGDFFVDSASKIAKRLNVPTFIIGATIVSIATTLPEMIVSVIAASEGKVDMSIGNAVGSVSANTALILAVAMTAMTIICKRKQFIIQILLLIGACATLTVSSLGGELHIAGSVVLLAVFGVFTVKNLISGKKESFSQDPEEENAAAEEKPGKKETAKDIILFIVGAAGIAIGSELMVDSASKIAEWLGVPERIISLTLVAVGTSLPELVTTVTAIIKKESGLSIGNIIGANIIDLTLILPICSLVSGKPIPVPDNFAAVDMPACLIFTSVAMIPILIRQKASKWQGALLLLLYAGYMAILIKSPF